MSRRHTHSSQWRCGGHSEALTDEAQSTGTAAATDEGHTVPLIRPVASHCHLPQRPAVWRGGAAPASLRRPGRSAAHGTISKDEVPIEVNSSNIQLSRDGTKEAAALNAHGTQIKLNIPQ